MSFSIQYIAQRNHVNGFQQAEMDNICELPYNDPERIVGFLRSRFFREKVYAWVGNVLLCVQTFKALNHSKKEQIMDHRDAPKSSNPNEPSVESVVDRLWFRMQNRITEYSQAAIIVSGESGAGKTHSTCLAIKAMANKVMDQTMECQDNHILWQVWSSVLLLNAFGNAPTLINRNSTRFGKLQRLQFVSGRLTGAFIDTFLIEKTRVVHVGAGEGNFHIFRQMLDSLSWKELKNLRLSKECEYKIAPKIRFASTYEETLKSMEILHIDQYLADVLKILSIILNLGNVTFICDGAGNLIADPGNQTFLENVANLMIVPIFSLHDILCTVQYTTRQGESSRKKSIFKSHCSSMQECETRRDCIMKCLYERLFRWLVNAINERIANGKAEQYINLLDLYGFESFDQNHFEQLCINYANERLQAFFNQNYLQTQHDELMADGIAVDKMDAILEECQERLRIMHGYPSIFSILNEECTMKRFKSEAYIAQGLALSIKNTKYFWVRDEEKALFTIRHYAGCVKYNATDMVTKNQDKVPEDIRKFLYNAEWTMIREILGSNEKAERRQTVLCYFKNSFDGLTKILNKSDVHYIKCLKANNVQMAEFFDDDYFTKQLFNCGIFEILKLSFQSYSMKLPKKLFIQQLGEESIEILKKIFSDEVFFSKSMIYLNQHVYDILVRMRRIKQNRAAKIIQKAWSTYTTKQIISAEIIQSLRSDFENVEKLGHVAKYLQRNPVEINFEGDPISLILEKYLNQMVSRKFRRNIFMTNAIVSRYKLIDISISEKSLGLMDIF